MTHNIFFISDTHFGHANALTFKCNDGNPMRPFSSVEEMDEHMVEQWNKTVRPQDKVYHLGDCVIARKNLPILGRLNGHKRLVRGNHDIFPTKEYMQYFEEIYGVRVYSKENFICSHIPLHPESLYRWKANIHGHLHCNRVMKDAGYDNQAEPKYTIDERYISVCVEQVNYTPISLDEILARLP